MGGETLKTGPVFFRSTPLKRSARYVYLEINTYLLDVSLILGYKFTGERARW